MRVGVLAVQGSYSLHRAALQRVGAEAVEVRRPLHLEGLDGIIIPGGESTTFQIELERSRMTKPLLERLRAGLPAWGTCAGAIMLGHGSGRPQPRWNLIDVETVRNAYGRQVDSFVADLAVKGFDSPFPGVFIRAPRFAAIGRGVEVPAEYSGEPVMAAAGNILVTAFHPELTGDDRVHRYFLERMCGFEGRARLKSAG